MIKFHIERNIQYKDFLQIFLKKQNLMLSLKEIYPNKNITLTNYGRTAFELILGKYNLRDCKIMIPAFICPLFYYIFEKRNITPVLIDVDMKTFNITPETLKEGFNKSAKCLITNNMNGLPCEIEKIKKILTKDQILIEDCAHSLGAKHNGSYVGLTGDASFFSLYKNLPSIKGGFAITNNPLLRLKKEKVTINLLLKLLYFIGKNANFYKNLKKEDYLYKEELVYNKVNPLGISKISERIAAFYIKRLGRIIDSRKRVAKEIILRLSNNNLIFQSNPNDEHVYTYFSFLLPNKIADKRIEFLKALRKQGIVGRIIWGKPLGNMYNQKCPNTKEISKRIVGIPIDPNYSEKEIESLCMGVLNALIEFQ